MLTLKDALIKLSADLISLSTDAREQGNRGLSLGYYKSATLVRDFLSNNPTLTTDESQPATALKS